MTPEVEVGQLWVNPTSKCKRLVKRPCPEYSKGEVAFWLSDLDGSDEAWARASYIRMTYTFFGWASGYGHDAPRSLEKGEETGGDPAPTPDKSPVSSLYYDSDPEMLKYRRAMGILLNKSAAAHMLAERPALVEAPCPPYYPAR